MTTIDANSIHREKGLDHLRKVFDAAEVEIVPHPNGAAPTSETRALDFVNASSWAGQTPKKRRWLASTRIPRATVTMLTGDGAAGKTTIGLQLGVATVRGTDWLGAIIEEHGPVIFFSAEEDSDEVHRRLDAIVAHHGIDMNALDGLHILCMPGEDAVLGAADRSGVV